MQLIYISIVFLFYTAIVVKSLQQNLYRESVLNYKLKQSYIPLEKECSPKLELLNCGASPFNMPRISPYQSAIILSNLVLNAKCEDLSRVSTKWEVWLVTSNNAHIREIEFFDKQNYFVEEGSLYYGIYMVKVQSNVFFSNVMHDFANKLSVNAFCFFEMVSLPVETVILGGPKRHLFFRNPITLSILTFVFPDVCESNQGMGKIPPLKIIYNWQCDSGDYFCSPFKTTESSREIIGPFIQNKEYKFSLKVHLSEEYSGYTKALSQQPEFQVIKMDSVSELELYIECMMNCGGSVFKSNPQEIIHLEAKLSTGFEEKNKSIIYHWDYTIMGSVEKIENIAEIRENGTADKVFAVKRNKLLESHKYIFTVSLGTSLHAELVVETCSLPKSPECTISPDSGIRGETYFDIKCRVSKQKDDILPVRFEFFDRYTNDDFGRYLGLSTTGILKRVVLTRDKLFVRSINIFGAYFETFINLKLSPFTQNRSDLILLPSKHTLGNYIYRIGLITAYGDYLNSQAFSSNLTNLLLTSLKDEEMYIEEITGATLLINALHIIFCNASNEIQYLESKTVEDIAKIMYHVSEIAKDTVTDLFKFSRYETTVRVLDIANYIINCCSDLLGNSGISRYNTLDRSVYYDLKNGGFYIIESLNNILTAVAFKVLISFEQINFNSKYIRVVLLNIGHKFEDIFHPSLVVQRPLSTTKNCSRILPEFQTQIIVFKKRPFWWTSRPGGEINTNIFDLQQKHGADYILINEPMKKRYNIDLDVVDFKPLVIHGSVKQPNPKDGPDVNDFVVAVHRFAPVVNSKSFVKFSGMNGSTILKAVMLQDQRPDFDYMNLNATIVTNESSSLSLTMKESNNHLFLYLGILPGEGVQVGETINYTFELFTASCKVRRFGSWMMGSRCKVTDETNKKQLFCACSMFNFTLGGRMFIPPNDFNPFSDIPLLISASDHPFPIVFLVVVVILYAFMFLWTSRKDKRNRKEIDLIVLEDNDMRDNCGYLVGVFTGSRLRAGTTSNVGIMLLGEEGMSRSHILKSERRPTLQANSDDWFILYTRHHLGSLTNIIIWMDYSGSRPHWYCSKIFVCDLEKYETDIFYVETWFGVNIQEIHLKMVKECATYKEINNVNRIISENLEYGFREKHLWLSLFIRHPRSLLGSSHRLTIVFCSLFVTIAVSALIYFLAMSQTEDLPHYEISKETFVYGIVSGLVGSLFSMITLHFFKASFKPGPCPTHDHEHIEDALMYHLERQTSVLEDPSWLKQIKKIIHYVQPCQVIPVQTNEDNLVGVKISRRKIVFAILLCIVISVLSIHLAVICGIHFTEVKSLLWLTSLAIGMIQTVCVTMPIKILVTALMCVLSKTRYFPLMSHIVGISETSRGSHRRRTYENFSEHLTQRKSLLKSFCPMNAFSEKDLRIKQFRITVLWTSLYVFGCLLLLALVSWLILEFKLNEFCVINNTVCREIGSLKSCQLTHYSTIKSYQQFLDQIQIKILPALYSRVWYNGAIKTLKTESFPDSGWLGNEESRLIGPPRLRQIRVKNVDYCNIPQVMINKSSPCFVQLKDETEDKGKYSTGWGTDDWIDCQFDQSSWHFSDEKQAMGAIIRTPSGFTCHGGGYISSLKGTERDANLVIRNLIDTKWIDSYTRVLMLEFTTYNVNKGVFTSAAFFAEATPYGTIVTNQVVRSVKLSYLPLSGIVFLAYFSVFLLRVLIVMNILGIENFLKNLWNVQEISILMYYFLSAIYYSNMLIQKKKYQEASGNQGNDVYFQVQILASEIYRMNNTISILFCLVAFRMLRIIRFNADVRQYLHDLHSAMQGIFWIWVVLCLFIFVQWRFVMFLVVPPPGDSVKDILIYQSDFKIIIYQYKDNHGKLLAFLLSLLTQVGMFSYVCSLTHYYRKGQLKRKPSVDKFKKQYSRYSRLWESSTFSQ